jgi:hypothetical protein
MYIKILYNVYTYILFSVHCPKVQSQKSKFKFAEYLSDAELIINYVYNIYSEIIGKFF